MNPTHLKGRPKGRKRSIGDAISSALSRSSSAVLCHELGTSFAAMIKRGRINSVRDVTAMSARARCACSHSSYADLNGNRIQTRSIVQFLQSSSALNKVAIKSLAVLAGILALQGADYLFAADDELQEKEIVVYQVDKKISDFPAVDDFSSPEAAYATICRRYAAGTLDWRSVNCERVNQDFPPGPYEKPPAEVSHGIRNREVLETRMYRGYFAQVTAREENGKRPFDMRSFVLEGGRWLNRGNSRAATLEETTREFDRLVRREKDLAKIQPRTPVKDPQATVAQYVDYLRASGQRPKEYMLQAIAQHKLVAIGEIHHRPTYWSLNCAIVRDARFAKSAGTIYLELPMHAQQLIDDFLAAKHLDTAPVVMMLRDNLWMGWPDKAMLDFFTTVWQTNQSLEDSQRIRIRLVDMKRPWKEWLRDGNLKKHRTDRDKLMADNILGDMENSADPRHAIFIVGYAHIENLRLAGAELPITNAGWYLRNRLGDEVFCILQHGPVITNMGKVLGRTCLGLFDEAFANNGNAPVAFSLTDSPFGEQRYDFNGDRCQFSISNFQEAFDGYAYLEPLENEIFSPLIPGFYTDEVVQELDQRHRLAFGSGLVEGLGLPAANAQSFENWMSSSWGKSRLWRNFLGPRTAWHQGDTGDKYRFWTDSPAPANIDADRTTEEGLKRLVDDCFHHSFRDISARRAIKWGPITTDANGNTSIVYKYEATIRNKDTVIIEQIFTFGSNGGLVSLKDIEEGSGNE